MTRTQRQIEAHRLGDAVLQVRDEAGHPCIGRPVWVEQETHEFLFGCAVPDWGTLSPSEGTRYRARWEEVFNRPEPEGDALRVEVGERAPLSVLRGELDRRAAAGLPLDVHVGGQTVGMTDRDERESARRVAELYTLCFAHPSVRGIFWHGFRDGEKDAADGGLLRRDLAPKPAHRVLRKLVGVVWHTRAAGASDAAGRFLFRGFFGTYRVVVMADGRAAKVASFSLRRQPDTAGPFLLEL